MQQSKTITRRKTITVSCFFSYGVIGVMFGVMKKTIDRDILYNIITRITPKNNIFLIENFNNIFSYRVYKIWGKWGNENYKNIFIVAQSLKNVITPNITRITPTVKKQPSANITPNNFNTFYESRDVLLC